MTQTRVGACPTQTVRPSNRTVRLRPGGAALYYVSRVSRSFIKPPTLRTHRIGEERKASWFELFYDLAFVVAVAQLGQRLLGDSTLTGFLSYAGLFVAVWWAWASYTFYADRYDTDDLGQRLLSVLQMVAIVLLATSLTGDTDSTVAFALAYSLAQTAIVLMYVRAYRHVRETRPLVRGYIVGFSTSAAIWLISAAAPEPVRYFMWALAIGVSFATPYRVRRIQATVPLDPSHLPERFGLFTILVLGESLVAVVMGLSHEGWHLSPVTAAVLGVVAAVGLWWLYFDNADGVLVRRDPTVKRTWRPTAWIYSHLFLALGIVAAGIAVEYMVAHPLETVPTEQRFLLFGAVALALVSMAMMHIANMASHDRRTEQTKSTVRLVAAGVLVLIGLIGFSMTGMVALVALVAVLAGQIVTELVVIP